MKSCSKIQRETGIADIAMQVALQDEIERIKKSGIEVMFPHKQKQLSNKSRKFIKVISVFTFEQVVL